MVSEAKRQLTICNACRYCEGLCAVFPALERRAEFGHGDVTQLANLCHDCRACYDACMYSPPHEFAIDLPRTLSALRLADYDRYVWPSRVPRLLSGIQGLLAGSISAVGVMLAIAVAHVGWAGLLLDAKTAQSPYRLIPYTTLLTLMLGATVYAVAVMVVAGRRYWREVAHETTYPTLSAIGRAVLDAATLRNLRGGGQECFYPDDDKPSSKRRQLHAMVAYGFGLCFISTIAAAVAQDIFGVKPPYPWLSVPVISGTVGGVALLAGCAGLLMLKTQSSPATSLTEMTVKDYGLIGALAFLAATGLAVLLTRDSGAYGVILIIHLSAVVEALVMAPYSKFVHVEFRFLALVRDHLERGL